MSNSKLALRPSEGIYYVVPQKIGSPIILAQREDAEENPAHMFFWEKVLKSIAHEFDLTADAVNKLHTKYMAIPRGRVQKEVDSETFKYTGGYIILHGGDVPVTQIQNFVYQDFGLYPLAKEKKVIWKVDAHEKMDPNDRKTFLEIVKKK